MTARAKIASWSAGVALAGVLGFTVGALAQPAGGRMCRGGGGMGPGGGHDGDMMQIHSLFARRNEIQRTVTPIPGGVRTITESEDPAVAARLREHVKSMYARLREKRPINARDPLFAALFDNADKIHVEMQDTPKGITVTETSADPAVVGLVRRHCRGREPVPSERHAGDDAQSLTAAAGVSRFRRRGSARPS